MGNEAGSPQLTVIRIAPNSTTDKQGLIHVGDIIAEVNGRPVSTPDELGAVIQTSGPDIKFKVIPAGVGTNGDISRVRLKTIPGSSMTIFNNLHDYIHSAKMQYCCFILGW